MSTPSRPHLFTTESSLVRKVLRLALSAAIAANSLGFGLLYPAADRDQDLAADTVIVLAGHDGLQPSWFAVGRQRAVRSD
jgi:hypothetical protein